jgi:hypothetical protein
VFLATPPPTSDKQSCASGGVPAPRVRSHGIPLRTAVQSRCSSTARSCRNPKRVQSKRTHSIRPRGQARNKRDAHGQRSGNPAVSPGPGPATLLAADQDSGTQPRRLRAGSRARYEAPGFLNGQCTNNGPTPPDVSLGRHRRPPAHDRSAHGSSTHPDGRRLTTPTPLSAATGVPRPTIGPHAGAQRATPAAALHH